MQIFRNSDYQIMPWKNGSGSTCQLAVSDDCNQEDELPLWRLSIATVAEDGPFSVFEHFDRCIMLLEGQGMRLKFNDDDWLTIDHPLQCQLFSGAWNTECELINGEIRDFNLMVDRRRASFDVSILRLQSGQSTSFQIETIDKVADFSLLYMIKGTSCVSTQNRPSNHFSEQPEGVRRAKLEPAQTMILQTKSNNQLLQSISAETDAVIFLANVNYKI